MFKPVEVKPLPGYRLCIRYDDGVEGEVDLPELAARASSPCGMNPRAFENVSVGPQREIRWSYAVDLCPDALYLEITGKCPEAVFTRLS